MAYDEKLDSRVEDIVEEHSEVSQKKMFGWLCFLFKRNMFCGVDNKSRLMIRVGADNYTVTLKLKHATKMTFLETPLLIFAWIKFSWKN
jgi:hypothetical protein